MHCWPPKKVDAELGLQDESIPSAQLWRKLGLVKGREDGTVSKTFSASVRRRKD